LTVFRRRVEQLHINSIWGLNLKYNDVEETAAQAALLVRSASLLTLGVAHSAILRTFPQADTFMGSRKDLTKDVTLEYVQIGNEASRSDLSGGIKANHPHTSSAARLLLPKPQGLRRAMATSRLRGEGHASPWFS